jgi:peptidoglycan/xylan/chitin deacetylase (PgdA/CDA1 family)
MAEPRFCYKHPTHIAKRKCFQCNRPLCPNCQLKLDHHLFCGEACHKLYSAAISDRTPTRYGRYALYTSLALLIGGFIYFGLLADAFYNGSEQGTQPNLSQIAPSLPVKTETPTRVEDITITRPINGMKSASQTIELEGRAPQNSVVAAYLNGTLVASTLARSSVYHFPQVLLTKHANVIQTRFYLDNGSSNSSSAIMVFFQEPIRSSTTTDWGFFQNSSDNISRGNLNRKELVLTFDGGSESNSCEAILNALDNQKIRTTIFLTGEFIQKYPDLTRRMAERHEIGNHTFSHEHLTTYAENSKQHTAAELTRDELQGQLRKTEEIFYHTTGHRMAPLWRAPYGEHNLEIRRWAAELGYVHVAWTSNPKNHQNMDSLDWVPNENTPGYFPSMLIKERILSFGQNEPEQANGSIVLMHLGTQREDHDRLDKWLPEIIKTFRNRGYTFLTASELIDHQDLLPNLASNQ